MAIGTIGTVQRGRWAACICPDPTVVNNSRWRGRRSLVCRDGKRTGREKKPISFTEGNYTKGNIIIAGEDGSMVDSGYPGLNCRFDSGQRYGKQFRRKPTFEDALAELALFSHSSKRYGVSGVGGITVDLTRLWDSVGKTANVGTDTQTAVNDFDSLAPFNRRKCVGDWATVGGKPVFTVQSYFGDPDFAEDGTKGNYVAVEIDPLWYYQEDFSQDNPVSISGTIGVSPSMIFGWKPHPICLNADGTIPRKNIFAVLFIALKDGVAVSP